MTIDEISDLLPPSMLEGVETSEENSRNRCCWGGVNRGGGMEDTYICVGGVHIQLGWITVHNIQGARGGAPDGQTQKITVFSIHIY